MNGDVQDAIAALSERIGEEEPGVFTFRTTESIMSASTPDIKWVVPDLLPVGLTLLTGKAKIGKSTLAMQLLRSVATGGEFLGRKANQGKALYLALEDTQGRLKRRMEKQGWQNDDTINFLLYDDYRQRIGGPLNEEGLSRLTELIRGKGFSLIVIDTLGRTTDGDTNDYGVMVKALAQLQALAFDIECAFVIIHHNKKGTGERGLDDVMGSTGIVGTADSIWRLYRKFGETVGSLEITGRDLEEELSISLSQDVEHLLWKVDVGLGGQILSTKEQAVIQAVTELGAPTVQEVATRVSRDHSNTARTLKDLVRRSFLKHGPGKTYVVSQISSAERVQSEREEVEEVFGLVDGAKVPVSLEEAFGWTREEVEVTL